MAMTEETTNRTRERLAALREGHRRKMNTAAHKAEMAASIGEMGEVSINSTESERHREAFVALNVAIDIFDAMDIEPEGAVDEAYARLIAAAPDMLAALQIARNYLITGDQPTDKYAADDLEILDAAITKATT